MMNGTFGAVRFILGIALILGGIAAIAQFQAWDVGLVMAGFGVLLLGIGGEGGVDVGGWRVWGPVGLILIALGVIIYALRTLTPVS